MNEIKSRSKRTRVATVFSIAFFAIILLQLPLCAEAQYYTRYSLTVNVSEAGAGTVSPTYGLYVYGEVVKVTEVTNSGYLFDGWYLNGEYQGKLSTVYVTMYGDSVLDAAFSTRQAQLTITVNPQTGGNTAPLPQAWTYDYGVTVPVKAYPNDGYVFDGWYLDGMYKSLDINIDVLMSRDHQLDAYFATPGTAQPKPNDTRIPTKLIVSCKSSPSLSNLNAQIDGFLMTNGVVMPNTQIFISYSVTGGKDWIPLTSVNTNDKGMFSATWMPDVTGNYLIQASWDGDATYKEATDVVSFEMTTFKEETVFSITSNSTLSQLSFNSESNELTFGVTGASGTTGYVNLYVPKSLINDVTSLQVRLDESILSYTYQDSGDSWIILFNYAHSTHVVTVNLASQPGAYTSNGIPWFPIIGIAMAALIIVAVAVLLLVRRRKK